MKDVTSSLFALALWAAILSILGFIVLPLVLIYSVAFAAAWILMNSALLCSSLFVRLAGRREAARRLRGLFLH